MKRFYSHGKLLISGEYAVLDGAKALALPTKFGQSLEVISIDKPLLIWKSVDAFGTVWFEYEFKLSQFSNSNKEYQIENAVANRLFEILKIAKQLNPDFLNTTEGLLVSVHTEFPNDWGLGSSSTLVNNIASWANIDAFKLNALTFGGSGYDIACAKSESAIKYIIKDQIREIEQVEFKPPFSNSLFFIHLNKKQDSREGIRNYRSNTFDKHVLISEISEITDLMIACTSLESFQDLMEKHEHIISQILHKTSVKQSLFNDFDGSIKSLGAWGGDFVLAASKENPNAYFKDKGYSTVLSYSDMIL